MALPAFPVAARPAGAAPALGLGEFFVDLLLGDVLFIVVIAVTAVVMSILQAVLPHGDTEAEAIAAAERGGSGEGSDGGADAIPPRRLGGSGAVVTGDDGDPPAGSDSVREA